MSHTKSSTSRTAKPASRFRNGARALALAAAMFVPNNAAGQVAQTMAQGAEQGDTMRTPQYAAEIAKLPTAQRITEATAQTTAPDMRFFMVESDGLLAQYTTRHYITNADTRPADVTLSNSFLTYNQTIPPNGTINIEGRLRRWFSPGAVDIVDVRISGADPKKVDVVTKIIGYTHQSGFPGTLGIKMDKLDDIMVRATNTARGQFFFDTPQDPAYRLNGLFTSENNTHFTLLGAAPVSPDNLLQYRHFTLAQTDMGAAELLQFNDIMRDGGKSVAERGAYGWGNATTVDARGIPIMDAAKFAAIFTNVNSSNGDAYASVPRSVDDQDSEVLLLGVTAMRPGLDGSVYNSTVGIRNTGLNLYYPSNIVEVVFYPFTADGPGTPGGLWMMPGSVSYDNLLQQLHYPEGTVGAVRVECHGDVFLLPAPAGTPPQPCVQVNAHSVNLTDMVGESIPALRAKDQIQPGETGIITAMCDYSGAYSNLAFFSDTGATAVIEAYDYDGKPIGKRAPVYIPAKTYVQQQLGAIIGPTDFSQGHVRITSDNPLYAIGMRVDRASKEPTIVVPKKY